MKGLRILLVDDEPLMRLSMVDALETIGHDVEAAASGTDGIEAIRQRPFDLVITDLRLPGADGLTVLRATKEQSPDTEVVVITRSNGRWRIASIPSVPDAAASTSWPIVSNASTIDSRISGSSSTNRILSPFMTPSPSTNVHGTQEDRA